MTERETELTHDDLGTEVPAADAAEQAQPLSEAEEEADVEREELADVPLDADPADHADQVRSVPHDDEDYR
jgi:hypothetical protein